MVTNTVKNMNLVVGTNNYTEKIQENVLDLIFNIFLITLLISKLFINNLYSNVSKFTE